MLNQLPIESCGKLNPARPVRRQDFAKLRIRRNSVQAVVADWIVVVRAIEQVIELSTQNEVEPLVQWKAFLDGVVEVHIGRTGELVSPRTSQAGRACHAAKKYLSLDIV